MSNIKGKIREENLCLASLTKLGIDIYQNGKSETKVDRKPVIKEVSHVQTILDKYKTKHNIEDIRTVLSDYSLFRLNNRTYIEDLQNEPDFVLRDIIKEHPILNSFKTESNKFVIYESRTIVLPYGKEVGNKTWGKIDYLVNVCGYKLVRE